MRHSAAPMNFLHRPTSMRGSIRLAALAMLAGLAQWLACGPAAAELKLCNQTSYVLYAAVSIQQPREMVTQGWTRVVPGDCGTAIQEPLTARAYFVYARSSQSRATDSRSWGGAFRFCVRDQNFQLQMPFSATVCKPDDAAMASFALVPAGGARAWTMTLTETPAFATPADARAAGMRRFLVALGYLADSDNDAKHLNDAFAKFRLQSKLAANASPADMFTALQAQAKDGQKSSGYAICNDGNSEIWAALAYWSGQEFISRGWWDIAAGSCAAPITQSLGHDPIYLYASKQGNNHLVAGTDNFCISNAMFDIHGRERCESHGYTSKGFAATNAKGASGFVAHIGDAGLVGVQAATPK